MMWNEETIRAAASWQAFKQGREWARAGAVTQAAAGSSGWKGVVLDGGKPRRVNVTVKSTTDIATACGCPENRATGALCAHGVAVGIAALAPKPAEAKSPAPPRAPEVVGRTVVLPPDLAAALNRGVLAVALVACPAGEISPADRALHDWLVAHGSPGLPAQLLLKGEHLEEFLALLTGHERVCVGKDRLPLAVRNGARMQLGDARRQGNEIVIQAGLEAGWVMVGRSPWRVRDTEMARAGTAPMPHEMVESARKSSEGRDFVVDFKRLLGQLVDWQDWFSFPADGWISTLVFLLADMSVCLDLTGGLDRLGARLKVRYGGSEVIPGLGEVSGLPKCEGAICRVRDWDGEKSAEKRLLDSGWVRQGAGEFHLTGEESVLQFLVSGRERLMASGWVVREEDRLRQRRQGLKKVEAIFDQSDPSSVKLKFQTTDGSEIPQDEIRRMLRSGGRRANRGKSSSLVLGDSVEEAIELLSDLDVSQAGGGFRMDRRAWEVIQEFSKKTHEDLNSSRQQKFEIDFNQLLVTPRSYQTEGMGWLADRLDRYDGALLADDMGLGKTLQTIGVMEHLLESNAGVVLVVATVSLLDNWVAEWEKFAPGRTVRILRGSARDREREKVVDGDVVLTSFGTLARDLAWHLAREYRAVVVDEASLMRNPDTDHAKALCKLRAGKRLALTGTPLENGVRDLWSIFRFIQPGWLGTRAEFESRYETPLREGADAKALMRRLRWKTAPFFLRRTKEEVAADLPAKWVIDEFCGLSVDQQGVYRKLVEEGRRQAEDLQSSGQGGAARMRMLTALLRLRQACCDLALLGNDRLCELPVARRSAKLERLLEMLDDLLAGGRRVLVFSQFQKQLVEIGKCIAERGWGYLQLDGSTRERGKLVERFQADDGPPIFLISLKAGGYGLNLTAADTVIHFDPWWNPAAEAQATDRAHRIGQTRPVTVYRLLTRGTVEENVVRMQNRKRELATVIDEAGEADGGHSMEEMRRLLGES